MRIREHSGPIPKPMVRIGYRPILWHIMKYYAHYGHTDFILCLGHGADHIKDFFVNYNETVSNDFVLTGDGTVDLLTSDIHDWRITFVDTGLNASVGERLQAIQPFLGDDEIFLANYADGVTDAPLDEMIAFREKTDKAAVFLGVQPNYTSHVIRAGEDGTVNEIAHVTEVGLQINGGFFVMHKRVFDYMHPGEELVHEPFLRMIAERDLGTYQHSGFWACMDTFKEKSMLEDIHNQGNAPWEVWEQTIEPSGDGQISAAPEVAVRA